MTKEQLGLEIFNASYLTGNFMLRSGVYSNEYFDKYRFEAHPSILKATALELKKMLPSDTEMIAGLELGGIPLATALSLETGLPTLFVRKEAKNHGTRKWVEGLAFQDKKICVIEDVVTTGGQIISSIDALRSEGGIVEHTLCVIVRAGKAYRNLEQHQIQLHSVFSMQELKQIGTQAG
jgi:orotate phosphoribosyltransferase